MKTKILLACILTAGLIPSVAPAAETNHWSCDFSLYALAAGMSGNATVKGVNANADVGFDKIVEHLKMGGMGTARIGYDRWALTTDIIYMKLGASKDAVSVDLEQWVIEPTLSYRVCKNFEALAGVRYNNINGGISGPFGRNPTGTQDWYDPIVGGNVFLPFSQSLSFNVRGDIGGFGVGSDLTWQAFPYFNWQFAKYASLQVGYRFLYTDYETGSRFNQFKYDILTSGPQVGFSLHF